MCHFATWYDHTFRACLPHLKPHHEGIMKVALCGCTQLHYLPSSLPMSHLIKSSTASRFRLYHLSTPHSSWPYSREALTTQWVPHINQAMPHRTSPSIPQQPLGPYPLSQPNYSPVKCMNKCLYKKLIEVITRSYSWLDKV